VNACDESVAAATERTRAARPSPPLAAEVPQQLLTKGDSFGGSSLDYWLLSRLRSTLGNPPVEFAMGNGARVGSDARLLSSRPIHGCASVMPTATAVLPSRVTW